MKKSVAKVEALLGKFSNLSARALVEKFHDSSDRKQNRYITEEGRKTLTILTKVSDC